MAWTPTAPPATIWTPQSDPATDWANARAALLTDSGEPLLSDDGGVLGADGAPPPTSTWTPA